MNKLVFQVLLGKVHNWWCQTLLKGIPARENRVAPVMQHETFEFLNQ